MTPEVKLRTLASANATLQGYFGTAPFRWFDTYLPQTQIESGPCAVVRRISTARDYTMPGINAMSQPRFQIDVFHTDPETARAATAAVIDFLGTISLAQNNQFGSPVTTPPQFPNFVLNQRDGMDFELEPPVFVQSLDVRVFNLES